MDTNAESNAIKEVDSIPLFCAVRKAARESQLSRWLNVGFRYTHSRKPIGIQIFTINPRHNPDVPAIDLSIDDKLVVRHDDIDNKEMYNKVLYRAKDIEDLVAWLNTQFTV